MREYIYPVYAKDFLLMNNYEQFADLVQLTFILTPEQWQEVLQEWVYKETILTTQN